MKIGGKKADYVEFEGKPVIGLYKSCNKEGRVLFYYYFNDKGKRVSCPSDITIALQRFSSQNTQHYQPTQSQIDDEYVLRRFTELLNENRYEVAKKTGLAQLINLEHIAPLPKPLTLQQVYDKYINLKRPKPMSKIYALKVKWWFGEFRDILRRSQIRDITYDDIKRYNEQIHSDAKIKKAKPDTYVSHRFNCIHSVFNQVCKKELTYDKADKIFIYQEFAGILIGAGPYAQWCLEHGWSFIHPNFRGPNNNATATGSDYVINDILDSVRFVFQRCSVDKSRVYLVGCSGGGYTALKHCLNVVP